MKVKADNQDFLLSLLTHNIVDTGAYSSIEFIQEKISYAKSIAEFNNIDLKIIPSNDYTTIYTEIKAKGVDGLHKFFDSLNKVAIYPGRFTFIEAKDSVIFTFIVYPDNFEEGELIIECPSKGRVFYPMYNTSQIIVSRISDNIFRYSFDRPIGKEETIKLTFPKSNIYSDTKYFYQEERFWLFLFALIGAVVGLLQLPKLLPRIKK